MIRIKPDIEKAKSILSMTEDRIDFLNKIEDIKFITVIVENYYEIIKELTTAVLLIDGFKAVGEYSHKESIDYLSKMEFLEDDIMFMQDLRVRRNKSSYEGKKIDDSYLERHKIKLDELVKKLKGLVCEKLSGL